MLQPSPGHHMLNTWSHMGYMVVHWKKQMPHPIISIFRMPHVDFGLVHGCTLAARIRDLENQWQG